MSCHHWKRGVIVKEPFKSKNVFFENIHLSEKRALQDMLWGQTLQIDLTYCFEHLGLKRRDLCSLSRIIRNTRAIHCNCVRRKSTTKWLTVIALANKGNDNIFLGSLVLLQQHWILIRPLDQQEVTESQAYLCFGLELWGMGWGGDEEEVWSWSSCLVWKHMPQGARLAE